MTFVTLMCEVIVEAWLTAKSGNTTIIVKQKRPRARMAVWHHFHGHTEQIVERP